MTKTQRRILFYILFILYIVGVKFKNGSVCKSSNQSTYIDQIHAKHIWSMFRRELLLMKINQYLGRKPGKNYYIFKKIA